MKEKTRAASSAEVFDRAAEFFGVLSTPARLRIIRALCAGERNVSHLLDVIKVSQPNMSRHLNVLYKAGVVVKRRSGPQVFCRIADASVVRICSSVCSRVEIEADEMPQMDAGSSAIRCRNEPQAKNLLKEIN